MMRISNLKNSLLFLGISAIAFASCEKKDDKGPDTPNPVGNKPPIELDCNYFQEDRILVNDPEAPVDYIIKCVMAVSADVKIEPGVVIEFEQDAGINVKSKASLSAIGTSNNPVIFRGAKKEAGYWRGIIFFSNSPLNELAYVQVEDAGGRAFNSNEDKGGVVVYDLAQLKMNHSKVTNSASYGINACYRTTNTLILNNNTFTNNNGPAYINCALIDALNSTNSFKGNTEDFVRLYTRGSFISKASTWHKLDVGYRVNGSFDIRNLVTIQPGVYVESTQETTFKVGRTGGLKAVGTLSEPIIFTGMSKVAKAWKGIYFESKHPENEIAFAEIHYSGLDVPQGNVWLWYESLLNIHDVKFVNIEGCAINHRLASGNKPNPNLTIGSNITIDGSETGCIDKTW